MKPSKVKDLLLKLLPAGEPVLLVGSPGVGKTQVVEQACAELGKTVWAKTGYDLIVMHPVVEDPTDYKGMPYAGKTEDGELGAMFLPFGNLWKIIKADRPTVVFMDDLGQAMPAVQASIMQLVLARKVNGHKVSDHVVFVAATNRRTDQAAVTGMITPLLDRFTTVISFDFDLDDWVAWAMHNDMPPVLISFARYRTKLINAFEANKDMKKSPTPRSVAGVGRLLNRGIDDYEVIAGAAGEGFATEFLAFYRTFGKIPTREEILENPEGAWVPDEPDACYAVAGMLAHAATAENFEVILKYLNRMSREFAVLCVKDAIKKGPDITESKAFLEWAIKNQEIFGFSTKAA